jgi:hypothetical protein
MVLFPGHWRLTGMCPSIAEKTQEPLYRRANGWTRPCVTRDWQRAPPSPSPSPSPTRLKSWTTQVACLADDSRGLNPQKNTFNIVVVFFEQLG